MSEYDFPRKTFTVAATGHTYEYIRIAATSPSKSTIAFFHGFPAVASGWRHQIKYFADQGYGIFAPDLLGFGGSSRPASALEYRSRLVVADLIAILDHEKIMNFHVVGHDAGSYVVSRLYNYHPSRLLSLTFISVPYSPPAAHFDLTTINQMTKKLIGFEKFAYCEFLASDRSPELIEQHVSLPFPSISLSHANTLQLESFLSLAYHADATIKADNFYPPGAMEAWLQSNRNDGPANLLLSPTEAADWLASFRASGLRGATRGYQLMTDNLNEAHEKADLAAGKLTTKIRGIPVLAVDATPDKASLPGFMEGAFKGVVDSYALRVVARQGHYPHVVSREEVNRWIGELVATGRVDD